MSGPEYHESDELIDVFGDHCRRHVAVGALVGSFVESLVVEPPLTRVDITMAELSVELSADDVHPAQLAISGRTSARFMAVGCWQLERGSPA